MTKTELGRALEIAKSDHDLSDSDFGNLSGFGLPGFRPVYTTLGAVARLIRWQCGRLDGTWDSVNLDEIARFGRRLFLILDDNSDGKRTATG